MISIEAVLCYRTYADKLPAAMIFGTDETNNQKLGPPTEDTLQHDHPRHTQLPLFYPSPPVSLSTWSSSSRFRASFSRTLILPLSSRATGVSQPELSAIEPPAPTSRLSAATSRLYGSVNVHTEQDKAN